MPCSRKPCTTTCCRVSVARCTCHSPKPLASHPELSVDGTSSAPAELARHWQAAGRLPEALAQSVSAATAAAERWAPAEALGHYRRALDLWREWPTRPVAGVSLVALRKAAATAASDAGAAGEAVALTRAVLTDVGPDDVELYAETLCDLSTYLWMTGAVDETRVVDDELARRLPPDRTPARARGLGSLGSRALLEARMLDAIPLLSEAATIAGELGDEEARQAALRALGSANGALGCDEEAVRLLLSSLEIAATWASSQISDFKSRISDLTCDAGTRSSSPAPRGCPRRLRCGWARSSRDPGKCCTSAVFGSRARQRRYSSLTSVSSSLISRQQLP